MKKLLFTLLLFLITGAAMAQFQPVSPVQLTTNTVYYEPSTGHYWTYSGSVYGWRQITDSLQLKKFGGNYLPLVFTTPQTITGAVTGATYPNGAISFKNSVSVNGTGLVGVGYFFHNLGTATGSGSYLLDGLFGLNGFGSQGPGYFGAPIYVNNVRANFGNTGVRAPITLKDTLNRQTLRIYNNGNIIIPGSLNDTLDMPGVSHGFRVGGSVVRFTGLTTGTPLYNLLIDANGNMITGTVPVIPTNTYLTLASPNQTVTQVPTFSGTGSTGGIKIAVTNATTDGVHADDNVGAGFHGFYSSENYQLTVGGDSRKVTTSLGGTSIYNAIGTDIFDQNWSTDPTKILVTGLPVQYGNGLQSTNTPTLSADVVPLGYLQSNYTATKMDVFGIGGQSNARGLYSDLSLQPAIPSGWAYVWNAGTITTVTTGPIGSGTSGSAWAAFAIAYHNRTGHAILFVPTAVSGSAQVAAGDAGQGNWDTSGTLLTTSIAMIDSALARIPTGFVGNFKGILWSQGETDAAAITAGTYPVGTYTTAFTTMRATYRTHYSPVMPFYIFRTGGTAASNSQIQASQEAAAVSEVNTDVVFREARDYTIANSYLNASQPAHYTQAGYNRMGQIGADYILSLRHYNFLQGEFANFGTTSSSNITTLSINTPITAQGSGTANGVLSNGTIQSDVTTATSYFNVNPTTVAASFTETNLYGYRIGSTNIGAASTVTALTGFQVDASALGATNTKGFRSQLASAANTYNLYIDGSANNYIAGPVGFGATVNPTATVHIGGTRTIPAWGNVPAIFNVSSATVTDNSTADGATVTNAFLSGFAVNNIAATNASTGITYTNVGTVTIFGEPTAGSNVSFTNSAALDVVTGKVRIRNLAASRAVTTDANNNLTTIAVTGTGSAVLQTSPSLITPALGVATVTTLNKVTITQPASTATLTLPSSATFAVGVGMTITAGAGGQTFTFPTTSASIARTDAAQTFTGIQSFSSNPVLNTTSVVGQVWTATNTSGSGNWAATSVANVAHTIFTPTTGNTITLINNQRNIINPSGALLALTITLPASPANNDVVFITFTQAVTTVTYAGGTVVDGITSPAAGAYKVLTYDSGTTSWY